MRWGRPEMEYKQSSICSNQTTQAFGIIKYGLKIYKEINKFMVYPALTVVALSAYAIAFPMRLAPNSRLWIVKTTRALLRP